MPGSNYDQGQEIFSKLRALQEAISKIAFTSAVPGFGEVQSLILKVVEERKEATSEKDLLWMILEGTENVRVLGSGDVAAHFIMDNIKNILAGYKTTTVAAAWTLILLASNPGWQAKVCQEVVQALHGGQLPMLT
ncbi:hypothetical protein ACJRO7_003941 [Eucalyptus globulus]|uniref:Cytochrome P450 n=1 Tax=Eucalyptus globulus TaxID=34317 RepID=A0ABD3IY54_EUCGL